MTDVVNDVFRCTYATIDVYANTVSNWIIKKPLCETRYMAQLHSGAATWITLLVKKKKSKNCSSKLVHIAIYRSPGVFKHEALIPVNSLFFFIAIMECCLFL